MRQGAARTGRPHRIALAFVAAVVLAWMLAMVLTLRAAALPDEESGMILALFPPGRSVEADFSAIVRAGAQPVRRSGIPFLWIVSAREPGLVRRLKQEGALATFGAFPFAPVLAGCAAVTRDVDHARTSLDLVR